MKYIKLFKDTLSVLNDLSDEQSGQLFKAIVNYSNDEEVNLDGLMIAVFSQFKLQIDNAKADYIEVCNRNKANGEKGGRKNTTRLKKNPLEPTRTHSVKKEPTQSQDKEEDKDKEEKELIGYDLFISDLKSKVSIKSKVTKTKEGKELFKNITDIQKLKIDYIEHQKEKGSFSQRVTAFMEDYNPHQNNISDTGIFKGDIYG